MLLPHVSAAYNKSVNAATGLAPNEIHFGRLPRLPLSVFEPQNIGGHQSLGRDYLVYMNLATDRQQRAYSLVRELHRLTVSRLQRRNAPIMAALLASPPFSVGGWAWVYNSASTIRQGVKKGTDATVLKTKLSLNWKGPFKILAVGPMQPPTPSITTRYKTSCSSSMYLQIFRDVTPNHASPSNDASPATTPTTPATYPSTCQRTSQHTSSQLLLPSRPPTTSPSTTSHHHRSASRLSRSPATNSYAAAAESSPSYTRPTEPDSSAPRGNASSTSNTFGAIFYSTGPESRHNTVRPTASTAR